MDRFREAAAINLPGSSSDLNTLAQTGSIAERISAIERLGIMRNRTAIPVLTEALKDKNNEIRCSAGTLKLWQPRCHQTANGLDQR
jgi:HEAT repeat protein